MVRESAEVCVTAAVIWCQEPSNGNSPYKQRKTIRYSTLHSVEFTAIQHQRCAIGQAREVPLERSFARNPEALKGRATMNNSGPYGTMWVEISATLTVPSRSPVSNRDAANTTGRHILEIASNRRLAAPRARSGSALRNNVQVARPAERAPADSRSTPCLLRTFGGQPALAHAWPAGSEFRHGSMGPSNTAAVVAPGSLPS